MMATPESWIKKTFKDLRFTPVALPSSGWEEFRSQIEHRKLVDAMHITCQSINKEAGQMIIYERLYLPPQKVICKYMFERPSMECQMALTLRETGPTLVYSSYKPNRVVGYGAIKDFYQYFVQPSQWTVKHELRVYPAVVNNIDLQQWFTYLLSGFRNSRKPRPKDYGVPKFK